MVNDTKDSVSIFDSSMKYIYLCFSSFCVSYAFHKYNTLKFAKRIFGRVQTSIRNVEEEQN